MIISKKKEEWNEGKRNGVQMIKHPKSLKLRMGIGEVSIEHFSRENYLNTSFRISLTQGFILGPFLV